MAFPSPHFATPQNVVLEVNHILRYRNIWPLCAHTLRHPRKWCRNSKAGTVCGFAKCGPTNQGYIIVLGQQAENLARLLIWRHRECYYSAVVDSIWPVFARKNGQFAGRRETLSTDFIRRFKPLLLTSFGVCSCFLSWLGCEKMSELGCDAHSTQTDFCAKNGQFAGHRETLSTEFIRRFKLLFPMSFGVCSRCLSFLGCGKMSELGCDAHSTLCGQADFCAKNGQFASHRETLSTEFIRPFKLLLLM